MCKTKLVSSFSCHLLGEVAQLVEHFSFVAGLLDCPLFVVGCADSLVQFVHVEGGVRYAFFRFVVGWIAGHPLEINCVCCTIYFLVALGNQWIQFSTRLQSLRLLIRSLIHRNQSSFVFHTFIVLPTCVNRRYRPIIFMYAASFGWIVGQLAARRCRLLSLYLHQNIIFELALLYTLFWCENETLTILHAFLPLAFVVAAIIPVHLPIASS